MGTWTKVGRQQCRGKNTGTPASNPSQPLADRGPYIRLRSQSPHHKEVPMPACKAFEGSTGKRRVRHPGAQRVAETVGLTSSARARVTMASTCKALAVCQVLCLGALHILTYSQQTSRGSPPILILQIKNHCYREIK